MDLKFYYIKVDGEVYGPKSLDEMLSLPLSDDTLVTEEGFNGEWHEAGAIDFNHLKAVSENGISYAAVSSISHHWNWLAFLMPWAWGIINKKYWAILSIVFNFIPYVGLLLYLIFGFTCAIYDRKNY